MPQMPAPGRAAPALTHEGWCLAGGYHISGPSSLGKLTIAQLVRAGAAVAVERRQRRLLAPLVCRQHDFSLRTVPLRVEPA